MWVGDIGDNDAERRHVTIYRVAEPEAGATRTSRAYVFRAAYPADILEDFRRVDADAVARFEAAVLPGDM